MEKTDWCKNNLQKLSTIIDVTKVDEHIPSCFLMSTILSFKSIEYKHDVYRCKGCDLLNL